MRAWNLFLFRNAVYVVQTESQREGEEPDSVIPVLF